MGLGTSSEKVREENPKIYDFAKAIDKAIESQEGNHIFYLLQSSRSSSSNGGTLSVVLYNPIFSAKCFRLLELQEASEAGEKFRKLADHLEPFVKNIVSVYQAELLQNILIQFENNPSWTASHVAAELEIIECFENANFMKEAQSSSPNEDGMTPLHVACKDGKRKAIKKLLAVAPKFSKDSLGNRPLHYLIENHPELVEAASSLASSIGDQFRESLNTLNQYSESPVHVAIRLSQDKALKLLIDQGANSRLLCGHMYAIHLALKNKSDKCAELLVNQDNRCINDKDLRYGSLPLHWVKTPKSVHMLVQNGADVNCKSDSGEVPLHIITKKKRLDCVVALISNGADINAINKDGRNSLHLAVEAEDADIVKALLLFEIDHELKDNQGVTANDIAERKEASSTITDVKNALKMIPAIQRGPPSETSLQQGLLGQAKLAYKEAKYKIKNPLQKIDSNNSSLLKSKTGKEAVLCMDGGGIRGLVLTELLFALEEATGHQASELFDWISGTSTGSYLALAIATGKSVEGAQKAYFRFKDRVFEGGRPFDSKPLENFLIDEFGKDTMMNSFSHPRVIIPALIADRKPAALHLFRNYEADYDEHFWSRDVRFKRPRKPEELELWRAARCGGAAPSYFRAMDRYIDGGIIANNPTLDVLTEIHNYKKHNEIRKKKEAKQVQTPKDVAMASDVSVKGTNDNLGIVISLGTGREPQISLKGIDLFMPSSIWETTEVIVSARDFGELLIDQVTNSDDHVVERAKSWCEMVGLSYFRFSPPLSKKIELDEQNSNVLINMLWDARIYLHKNRDLVEKAGRILLGTD